MSKEAFIQLLEQWKIITLNFPHANYTLQEWWKQIVRWISQLYLEEQLLLNEDYLNDITIKRSGRVLQAQLNLWCKDLKSKTLSTEIETEIDRLYELHTQYSTRKNIIYYNW